MIITNEEAMKLCSREWWNRSEEMKKNEEHLREKERKKREEESLP